MAEDYLYLIRLALQTQGFAAGEAQAKKFGMTLKGLTVTTQKAADGTTIASQEILKIVPATAAAAKKTNDFMNAMRRAAIVAPVWMLLRNVMMFTFNALKEGFNFWRQTEDAIAQIRIASSSTKEEVTGLANSVIGLSTSLGVSAIEGLKAAKIFAQQGLTIQETFAMTRAAMIGAKVLEEDVATTAETLTAAIRAYNLSFTDGITLIDKWMGVQRQFAVTAKDLSEAFKVAGATAAGLGVSTDAFIGHITAIIETTRKSGSQAGNALQMIYSRLFSMGKDVIQTIAKVPIYLKKSGEATFQNTQAFRSQEQVLLELSLQWKNLDFYQRNQIANTIGSRRQIAPFMALMNSFTRSMDAQIQSVQSAGESMRALGIVSETTTYKLDQLHSTWLSTTKSFSQTTAWKGLIEGTRQVISGIQATIDMAGAMKREIIESFSQKQLQQEAIASEQKGLEGLLNLRKELSKQEVFKTNPEAIKYLDKIDATLEKSQSFKTLKGDTLEAKLADLSAKRKVSDINVIQSQITIENAGDLVGASVEQQKAIISTYRQQAEARYEALQVEKEINAIQEDANEEKALQLKEEQLLLDHNIELLKIKGATEKQILDYKIQQMQTIDILNRTEKEQLELKKLQYEKEQLITKEKLNQQNLTSAQAKVYKVSQKYGIDVATNIAGAMQGRWGGIEGLGGKSLEVFKEEFSSEWENYMGTKFFKENNYLRNLMSPTIPIPWKNILPQSPTSGIAGNKNVNVTAPTTLQININADGETGSIGDMAVDAIKKQLDNNSSVISKSIDNRINKY